MQQKHYTGNEYLIKNKKLRAKRGKEEKSLTADPISLLLFLLAGK
jgi:hypothetical protein